MFTFTSSHSAYHDAEQVLVEDQRLLLHTIFTKYGREGLCRSFLYISSKAHGNVPFEWNRAQQKLAATVGQNNIVLKFRQGGFTTWFLLCRLWLPMILVPGTFSLLVSQDDKTAQQHFEILRRAQDSFGAGGPMAGWFQRGLLKPRYLNRGELVYPALDSRILARSAGNPEVGQGLPGVRHLLCTEVSRWPHNPEETMSNLAECVTPNGTRDEEWTANGWGGYAFDTFMAAYSNPETSAYRAHFFPWPVHEEYSIEDPAEQARYVPEGSLYSDEEKGLMEKFQLQRGQIAWRRKKIAEIAGGERQFREKYPEDPFSAFLLSGTGFFDAEILRRRALEVEIERKEHVVNPFADGAFVIFRRPLSACRYVLHADVAWGRTEKTRDPDWSAFTVLKIDTGEQVASFRAHLPPETFAAAIREAAELYCDALVSVERNPGGGGESVLLFLTREFGYANVYQHREWDKERRNVLESPGLPMNATIRRLALDRLNYELRTSPQSFHDPILLNEAATFTRNTKGKLEAATGCHDDSVLAAAGAHLVRWVALGYYDPLMGSAAAAG